MSLRKADYDSMLKIDYHGPCADMLDNSCALVARMDRHTEPTGGKYFYQPRRSTRTSNIGNRTDGSSENLPSGSRPGYGNSTFEAKSVYATFRITGLAIRSTKRDADAFAKAQVKQIEDTTKDLKKDVNRQLFGDGSAELCRFSATCTSSAGGVLTATVTSDLYPVEPTKFLYAGEKVDIRLRKTGALVNSANGVTISSVDSATQVTITGAGNAQTYTYTSAESCDILCRKDNIGDNSTGSATVIKECFGLYAALHKSSPGDIWGTNFQITGDYGNVDRTAANADWKGNVLTSGTSGVRRTFSVNLMQLGADTAEKFGGEISLYQTNQSIFRVYGSMLATAKQFDGNAMQLDGGWDALKVGTIPMVKDIDAPDYTVFAIDESTLMLGVIGDWEWIEDDGGGVLIRLPGQDQYEGAMVRDMELICNKPNANCIISDVDHS